jgi:hypothetical protein
LNALGCPEARKQEYRSHRNANDLQISPCLVRLLRIAMRIQAYRAVGRLASLGSANLLSKCAKTWRCAPPEPGPITKRHVAWEKIPRRGPRASRRATYAGGSPSRRRSIRCCEPRRGRSSTTNIVEADAVAEVLLSTPQGKRFAADDHREAFRGSPPPPIIKDLSLGTMKGVALLYERYSSPKRASSSRSSTTLM